MPTSMFSATLLSTLRAAVGTSLLLSPSLTAKAFFLPTLTYSAAGTTLVTRLAGSRDLVLGLGTLYVVRRARRTFSKNGGERAALLESESESIAKEAHGAGFDGGAVRAVLYANVAVDAVDVLSCVYCLLGEGLGVEPLGMVGGGAVLFLGLGVWAVLGMKAGR